MDLVSDATWRAAEQHTVTELLLARLDSDPDSEYLDVCGTKLTARDVADTGGRLAGSLQQLGVQPGDRVATLVENSPEMLLAWFATIWLGAVSVPVNTAYKGEYLRHQLDDSRRPGAHRRRRFADRVQAISSRLAAPGARRSASASPAAMTGVSHAQLGRRARGRARRSRSTYARRRSPPSSTPAARPAFPRAACSRTTTTSPSPSRSATAGSARADDVVWTPLPMFHFNALVTAVVGTLVFGGRGAIFRRFSVSNFWPEMNRTGATIISTLGTHGVPARPRHRPARDAELRAPAGQHEPAAHGRGAAAARGRRRHQKPFRHRHFQRCLRRHRGEPRLVAAAGRAATGPRGAGVINSEYFDVRIFDDDDNELPRGTQGEIVVRPRKRRTSCSRATGAGPR